MCSSKLDKYECLTGEDLGYRPDPVQKAKFEYSPLGEVEYSPLGHMEDKTDNQLIAVENNIVNQPSAIKDGINNQPLSIKDRKISDTKNIQVRDVNGNEIKELNYLVDYIDNSIEKHIIRNNFSVQTRSRKDGKSIYKNYNFSDYTDL